MSVIGVELDSPRYRVRQLIFRAISADGASISFASLVDGRCGIVRGRQLMSAWDGDSRGVAAAVDQFLDLADLPRRLPKSRRPPVAVAVAAAAVPGGA
jgi:hypothetical protein